MLTPVREAQTHMGFCKVLTGPGYPCSGMD